MSCNENSGVSLLCPICNFPNSFDGVQPLHEHLAGDHFSLCQPNACKECQKAVRLLTNHHKQKKQHPELTAEMAASRKRFIDGQINSLIGCADAVRLCKAAITEPSASAAEAELAAEYMNAIAGIVESKRHADKQNHAMIEELSSKNSVPENGSSLKMKDAAIGAKSSSGSNLMEKFDEDLLKENHSIKTATTRGESTLLKKFPQTDDKDDEIEVVYDAANSSATQGQQLLNDGKQQGSSKNSESKQMEWVIAPIGLPPAQQPISQQKSKSARKRARQWEKKFINHPLVRKLCSKYDVANSSITQYQQLLNDGKKQQGSSKNSEGERMEWVKASSGLPPAQQQSCSAYVASSSSNKAVVEVCPNKAGGKNSQGGSQIVQIDKGAAPGKGTGQKSKLTLKRARQRERKKVINNPLIRELCPELAVLLAKRRELEKVYEEAKRQLDERCKIDMAELEKQMKKVQASDGYKRALEQVKAEKSKKKDQAPKASPKQNSGAKKRKMEKESSNALNPCTPTTLQPNANAFLNPAFLPPPGGIPFPPPMVPIRFFSAYPPAYPRHF